MLAGVNLTSSDALKIPQTALKMKVTFEVFAPLEMLEMSNSTSLSPWNESTLVCASGKGISAGELCSLSGGTERNCSNFKWRNLRENY